jgi:hypothetical protein
VCTRTRSSPPTSVTTLPPPAALLLSAIGIRLYVSGAVAGVLRLRGRVQAASQHCALPYRKKQLVFNTSAAPLAGLCTKVLK